MHMDQAQLREFSKALFGVDASVDRLTDHMATIQRLQAELLTAMDALSSMETVKMVNYEVKPEHLTDLLKKFPFLSDLHLDPRTLNGGSEVSYIAYRGMPMRSYFGKYLESHPNAYGYAMIHSSFPVYNFTTYLLRNTVRFKYETGLLSGGIITPPAGVYNSCATEASAMGRPQGPAYDLVNRLPEAVGGFSTRSLPMMSLQCGGSSPTSSLAHPHSSDTRNEFSAVCTGHDNHFIDNWVSRRIKILAEFNTFIDQATFWMSHFNLQDSFSAHMAPAMRGVGIDALVQPAVRDVSLEVIKTLSPILWKVWAAVSHPTDGTRSSLSITAGQFNAGAPSEGYGATLRRLLDQVEQTPRMFTHPDAQYLVGDTCHFALRHALTDAIISLSGPDRPTLFKHLMRAREVAYTIVLLDICAHKHREEYGAGPVVQGHIGRENFITILKYNILVSFYPDLYNFQDHCHNNYLWPEKDTTQYIAQRIMAPRALYKLLNRRRLSAAFGEALSLPGIPED